MSPFEDLEEILRMLPGIGPKQAKRFAYFLAHQSPQFLSRFSQHIENLKESIATCHECFRIFPLGKGAEKIICKTCSDTNRDKTTLLVVPRDSDFLHIEASGAYKGLYFLIGNTLSVIEEDPKKHLRFNELCNKIKKMGKDLSEVILASDLTPDGDYTIEWLTNELKKSFPNLKITALGRGLSTGTELEYADPETLKNAIISRKII